MRKIFVFSIIGLFLVSMLSTTTLAFAHTEGDPLLKTLKAGQTINVGRVYTWNDADNIYVKVAILWGDWEITETHLAIAETMEEIPQTKTGNPKVGHFAYKAMFDPAVMEYTYMIPLNDFTVGGTVVIAVHAVVKQMIDGGCYQEETAWACGFGFPGRNWATYFTYTVQ